MSGKPSLHQGKGMYTATGHLRERRVERAFTSGGPVVPSKVSIKVSICTLGVSKSIGPVFPVRPSPLLLKSLTYLRKSLDLWPRFWPEESRGVAARKVSASGSGVTGSGLESPSSQHYRASCPLGDPTRSPPVIDSAAPFVQLATERAPPLNV
jgi:hypothetical protein